MATENAVKDIKEPKTETPKRARVNAVSAPVVVKSVPTAIPNPTLTNSVTMALHRIPRPPNAFMIFANENRKILAEKHRRESNKEISIRLGKMWRALADDVKGKYHAQAKLTDLEHKKKYPDYVYNPRDARLRKEARRQRQIAGQQLARAMSHHLMVKNAKSSMIQLNTQRLGMQVAQPMACMGSPSSQQSQSNNFRREQENILRGLTFDNGIDKRPMGYFVAPNGQAYHVPGYPTLLSPHSLPMHSLANSTPSATITNSTNGGVISSQTFNRSHELVTSSSTTYAGQEEQQESEQESMSRVEVVNSFTIQTSMAQIQTPQPQLTETVQKSALLTLATEAVSQLSVGQQPEMKEEGVTGELNTGPAVLVENIVQLQDCEPATATSVLEQIAANEAEEEKQTAQEETSKKEEQPAIEVNKTIVEPAPTEVEEKEKQPDESEDKNETLQTDASYQRFGDAFGQKAPIMATWISKPESPALRMGRPMPLYLVHPSNPGLLAVRPTANGCVPYQMTSPAPSSPSQIMAGSPGNVVPWGSGPFFYMPMADMQPMTHMAPYAFDGNVMPYAYDTSMMSPVSFEPCYNTKGKKVSYAKENRPVIIKSSESLAKGQQAANPAASSPIEVSSNVSSKDENGSRVFGQILSSTMQLLNEEGENGDAKALTPTCHINYEVVEKEASPDHRLSQLTNVQPNTQYTVFY